MNKLNILFVCGAGLGSSFAAQMSAEDVLNKLGVEAKLDHCDISSAVSIAEEISRTSHLWHVKDTPRISSVECWFEHHRWKFNLFRENLY